MSPTPILPPSIPVAIVGAGQAGLSLSWFLRDRGIAHVVLERDVPVNSWRGERWDTFHLATPNWQCALPGHPYRGPDPDGFLGRDEIVAYLEGFVASFDPPVIPRVEVWALTRNDAGFLLETSAGPMRAGQVVVATGGYHTPAIPDDAADLPDTIRQFTAADYRAPGQLPPGADRRGPAGSRPRGSSRGGCGAAHPAPVSRPRLPRLARAHGLARHPGRAAPARAWRA